MILVRAFYALLLAVSFITHTVVAQPGCPNITTGPNQTVDCNITCVDLSATVLETGASTSYAVSSIPFNPPAPFTGGTAQFINTDDVFGSVINLPFNFCFYGNVYDQVVIGANGLITFDITEANQGCDWAFNDPIPSANLYTNCIMGAYHDIDPSQGGDISYFIQGTAPCRMFMVSFNDVPHFSCNCGFFGGCSRTTQQIVIYETTNVVEVYLEQKETCSGWNSGNAVVGIQDATGTNGVTPPGRNTGSWTASNEAWRFTPDGTPNFEVNWYDGGTLVGTGLTVNVCPSVTTTYEAEAIYTNCDGNVVTVTDQVTVTQNSTVSVSVSPTSADVCAGSSTTLTASSPNAGMTYTWSPGTGLSSTTGTTVDATPATSTTYTVTGNDGNCSASASATINIIELTATTSSTDASCGGSDGTATITPTSGSAPYTYVWNTTPSQTNQTATGLDAGNYDVTVTDALGCSLTETITVAAGSGSLSPPTMASTDVVCGQNNGTATATPVDGSAPYTYLWDDPSVQTTQTATGLAQGTYTVTVTDAGGCQSTNSVTVGQGQSTITATINNPSNVSCIGLCDGNATVTVQNGTAPITYLWNDTQTQSTATASGLCAGVYAVNAEDANGCIATATVTIAEPTELTAVAVLDQQSTCGNPDGAVTVNALGGTVATDYTYSWNTQPVQNTSSATGLPPGTYEATVTDDNGCSVVASVDVTSTQGFSASIQSTSDAACFGSCDGEATVVADANAVLPISYSWNSIPAQTGQTAIGLCAGQYSVTVTDGAGCIATESITINEPQPITATLSASYLTICIGESSDLDASIQGGIQPYSNYDWQAVPADPSLTPNVLSPTVSPMVTTTYTFVASDSNGCTSPPKVITIEVLDALQLNVIRPTTIDTGICPNETATIDLQAIGGDGSYSFYLEPDLTNPIQLPIQVSPSNTTTYNFQVEDGCSTPPASATVNVNVFQTPIVDFSGGPLSGCHEHTVNFTDQTTPTPTVWNWNFGDPNGITNVSPDQNPSHTFSGAGVYTISLEVTTAEGCVSDTAKMDYVEAFPLPVANFELDPERTNILQASIEFTDLSSPEISAWDWDFGTGDGSNEQNPLYQYTDTGTFTIRLEVETVHGCVANTRKNVVIEPDFMFYIPNSFTPNGDGKNDTFRPFGEGVDWETFEMRIYDRWGEEIFYTADIEQPWNGWYKNREVEMGVYVYVISIRDNSGNQHTYRDGVTVMR